MGCCDAPGLMPIEEAMDKMLSRIKPIQTTLSLPLAEALGFVLAEDILSPIHVPPFDNSAMDGYAIRGDDLDQEQYHVVAEIFAGHSYDQEIQKGQAVKIMTGAPTPIAGDTVIMREQAVQEGDFVRFPDAKIDVGQNVRMAG